MLRYLLSSTSLRAPEGETGSAEGTATVTQPRPLGVSSVEEVPAAVAADPASGAAPADGEHIEGAEPPAGATAAEKEDWRDKEIRRKHAQNQALKRENEELKAIAQRVPRTAAPAAGTEAVPAATVAADPKLVEVEAQKIVARNDYDRACNDANDKGKKTYGATWDKSIDNLQTLGGFDVDTMTGILATDDPARVLHELGSNPAEFQRVMELPPAKRLAEMVKIAIKPAPKKKVSEAPEPVEMLSGTGGPRGGGVNLYDDKTPDEDWYAKRTAEKRANWLKKQGRAA